MVLFPPPSYFVFYISNLLSYIQNNFSYELAPPTMGTIFLVNSYNRSLPCVAGPAFWVLAMRWRKYEKRNVLSKESSFFQIQKNSLSKERELQKNFREKRKGPGKKISRTSAKQKVAGRRRRGPRFGCSEANQKNVRIQ